MKTNKTDISESVYLENTKAGHNKFWKATLYKNDTVITEWGKIGGTSQSKEFPNAGVDFYSMKYIEKRRKGYEKPIVHTD